MSEQNRRRLKFTVQGVLLIAVVALGALSFIPPPSVAPANAQTPSTEEIDPTVYSAVQNLRRELALTNQDLAAMGCTQAQAEATLTALKGWYATNVASLEQAEGSLRSAERNLREAMRTYHRGPRDEALIANLPRLRDAVATAKTNREAVINAAIPAVASHIPPGQSTLWATARANLDRPGRLRYMPNVTDEQAAKYEMALRKQNRSGVSLDAMEQRLLAVSQRNEATVVRDRMSANLEAMHAVEQAVLPAPQELREATPSPSESESTRP